MSDDLLFVWRIKFQQKMKVRDNLEMCVCLIEHEICVWLLLLLFLKKFRFDYFSYVCGCVLLICWAVFFLCGFDNRLFFNVWLRCNLHSVLYCVKTFFFATPFLIFRTNYFKMNFTDGFCFASLALSLALLTLWLHSFSYLMFLQ